MLRKILTIVLLQTASFASLLGMYFAILPPSESRPIWHWVVLGASGTITFLLIAYEISDFVRTAPKTYRSEQKINRYLCRWVRSGGRVVIFSRDMSWAREPSVADILAAKAKRDELTIILEKEISLTDALKADGARIVPYEKFHHVPRSRFTIVDFDKEGARVAVGVHENGKHVIQEFRSGAHPFFAVAEDLVKFMLKA